MYNMTRPINGNQEYELAQMSNNPLFNCKLQHCLQVKSNPTLTVKFKTSKHLPNQSLNYCNVASFAQYFEYFFIDNYTYTITTNPNAKSDITVWSEFQESNRPMSYGEINLLLSVENIPHWKYYPHYKRYGEYGNGMINIYLYNHISKLIRTDNYISVPLIHQRISYYKKYCNALSMSHPTRFENKLFCLIVNKSGFNKEISHFVDCLQNAYIGKIDHISVYNNLIVNKSCYNSDELLNVFNRYKFVICFENSYLDGYITEKIFNCFFSKTIPIYKGSPIISSYISDKSFIDARNRISYIIAQISEIVNDEKKYNEIVNVDKISKLYNDENYKDELVQFITTRKEQIKNL